MRQALLLALIAAVAAGEAYGDRNVPLEIVFPPAALAENGGQVHDITKPPYGATGDGKTDDTAAFVRMMNDVAAGVERMRGKKGGGPSWFWVPNGTYLVSDSLVHEREIKEGFCGLRLIGQDRRRTIIRLKPESVS